MFTRIVMRMAVFMCMRTGMTANTITIMSRWHMSMHIVTPMAASTCMRTTMRMPLCTMPTVRMNIHTTARCITATARRARMRRE
jgi:hypothetical protein